jgi:hypothetical protein
LRTVKQSKNRYCVEGKISKMTLSSPQSARISVAIRLFIYGHKEDEDSFQEMTQTLVVDVMGGLIELESPVVIGSQILAVNENTNEGVGCCVASNQLNSNGKGEVGIIFNKPALDFWGIKFSSADRNSSKTEHAAVRHFIDGSGAPVAVEMYRRLMGRRH